MCLSNGKMHLIWDECFCNISASWHSTVWIFNLFLNFICMSILSGNFQFVCLRSVLCCTKSLWLSVCIYTLSSLPHLIGIWMLSFAGVLVTLESTHRSKVQLFLVQSHEAISFSYLPSPIDVNKRKIPWSNLGIDFLNSLWGRKYQHSPSF